MRRKWPFNITGQKLSVDRKSYSSSANIVGQGVFEASPNPSLKSLEIWRPSLLKDRDSDIRVRPAFSYRSVNCSEYPRDIKFKLSTTRCLGANFISSTQRLRGLFRFFRIRLSKI